MAESITGLNPPEPFIRKRTKALMNLYADLEADITILKFAPDLAHDLGITEDTVAQKARERQEEGMRLAVRSGIIPPSASI